MRDDIAPLIGGGREGSFRCRKGETDGRTPMGSLVQYGFKTSSLAVPFRTRRSNCYTISIHKEEGFGNGSQLPCQSKGGPH